MTTNRIINGQLASLLARFRHVNTIAIVDGPFPTYPNVETVDLAVVLGLPSIPDVLTAILPHIEVTSITMAQEFEDKVDAKVVSEYRKVISHLPVNIIAHENFKVKVGQALGIIHTGDNVPYSSVILNCG
ncbi:MAG: RbsD/FucU domain-containing protein [Candidatus Nanopelagicaceae bacterium]